MKPCNGKHNSCPNLIDYGEKYCPDCLPDQKQREKARVKAYDKERGSAKKRGYDVVWARLRQYKLKINPLCECPDCLAGAKRITSANMVHHIEPVKTHPELRLVLENLQSMARNCHERIEGRKR